MNLNRTDKLISPASVEHLNLLSSGNISGLGSLPSAIANNSSNPLGGSSMAIGHNNGHGLMAMMSFNN